jgi:hypothetical protein
VFAGLRVVSAGLHVVFAGLHVEGAGLRVVGAGLGVGGVSFGEAGAARTAPLLPCEPPAVEDSLHKARTQENNQSLE